jgi:hypothetical protein
MNQFQRTCLKAVCLLALVLLPACALEQVASPTPAGVFLSIADIQENYASYEGQLVSVRGYGVIMMTVPLCPGYTGMDKRTVFLGEQDQSITAVLTDSASGAERTGSLREFQGYVRVFNGEIGCPGGLQTANFPYFEIVAIK